MVRHADGITGKDDCFERILDYIERQEIQVHQFVLTFYCLKRSDARDVILASEHPAAVAVPQPGIPADRRLSAQADAVGRPVSAVRHRSDTSSAQWPQAESLIAISSFRSIFRVITMAGQVKVNIKVFVHLIT